GNLIRKQRFPEAPKEAPTTEQVASVAEPAPAPETVAAEALLNPPQQPEGAPAESDTAPSVASIDISPVSGEGTDGAASVTAPVAPTPAKPEAPKRRPGGFAVTGEMLSLAGCSGGDFEDILKAIGYRKITLKGDGGTETVIWRPSRPDQERRGPPRE